MAKPKRKFSMDAPIYKGSHEGGKITGLKTPSAPRESAKRKFQMEGPDLSGGGWVKNK